MTKTFGIDISRWQKGFDFDKAKAEGVRFAIVKASQSTFKDPEFENHYKNARRTGIPTGAYHYLTAVTVEAAKREAQFMIDDCLSGKTFEYPIFADAEDAVLKQLDKTTVDEIIKAFCNTLEKAGYWAGFYCNYDFYKNHCSGSQLAERYSLWLASWTKDAPADCQMWQFGGETNSVRTNKVAGQVCDQNYSFLDFPSLIRAKGLNGTATCKNTVENGGGASAKRGDGADAKAPSNTAKDSPRHQLGVGDTVRLRAGANIYGTHKKFARWVYGTKLFVREINGERAVVSTQKTGPVTGAANVGDLIY